VKGLGPNAPILTRGLFTLPDQVAREGSYLWEDGISSNACTIARADVSNCESTLSQTTTVDQNKVIVGKLPTTEEGLHEKLVIHSLEVQVRRVLSI